MPYKKTPAPVPAGMKHCFKCETTLDRSKFHRKAAAPDGLVSACIECRKKQRADNRANRKALEETYERLQQPKPTPKPEPEPEQRKYDIDPRFVGFTYNPYKERDIAKLERRQRRRKQATDV